MYLLTLTSLLANSESLTSMVLVFTVLMFQSWPIDINVFVKLRHLKLIVFGWGNPHRVLIWCNFWIVVKSCINQCFARVNYNWYSFNYHRRIIISSGLYTFCPIFHCGWYYRVVSIADNLCTKKRFSSIPLFILKNGFNSKMGYNGAHTVVWILVQVSISEINHH